jgi:hypothetical protein
MSTPALVDGVFDEDEITAERARAQLVEISTPLLDAFRAEIPSLKTSELIVWLTKMEMLMYRLVDENESEEMANAIAQSALIALADEIDRRLPGPKQ